MITHAIFLSEKWFLLVSNELNLEFNHVLAKLFCIDDEGAAEADRRYYEFQKNREDRILNNINNITNTHFVQKYRLSKEAIQYLCNTLKELTNLRSPQRVSFEIKVLSALLFYANGDYQRVIGMANYMSQEAISRYIHQVTEALNLLNMTKKFIKFPNTPEARGQMKQNFYNLYGIPGVLGCVDGCHFRIFKPMAQEEHLYYCRKHYHSLNVQMVADYQYKIMTINAKFGGVSHDAFVWEYSQINTYMQSLHQQGESVWLLGDSGYPQRPWLMTPYTDPAPGTAAHQYNVAHRKARVIIENTFGCLKNRWRCLCKDRVLHLSPEKCAKIIIACSVLHNLALDFGVPGPVEQLVVHEEFQQNEIPYQDDQPLLPLGRLMRDRVAHRIAI